MAVLGSVPHCNSALPVLVYDLEGASGVLCHGHTTASEYAVWSGFRNLNSERKSVAYPDSAGLASVGTEDNNLGQRSLWRRCDLQSVRVPNEMRFEIIPSLFLSI